jgi:uncharacterized protein
MKIVLDTNALVSGLLTPFGPCGEIVRMLSSGELRLCIDARILTEYCDVLYRPKFGFEKTHIITLLDYIEHCGQIVAASPLALPLPDPDDEPFLEVAISGAVECLVTGNHTHFPAKLCGNVKILSPVDFLRRYKKRKK